MDLNKMQNEQGMSCAHCQNSGMCCAHGQWTTGKYLLLRWLLALLIMVIIFAIGFKLGEFKGTFINGGGYGGGMHGPRLQHGVMRMNGGDVMFYGAGGRTQALPQSNVEEDAMPAPTTKTTPAKPSTTPSTTK